MSEIEHYATFVSAIIIFQLIPGPGTLTILRTTARDGVLAGMGAVWGTLCGDLIYMLAAVLGLATLLAAYPSAFLTMRWLGIAYLIWMGVTLLRATSTASQVTILKPLGWWVHFQRALMVALTNPKAIMFFMAFFPMFLKADAKPYTLGLMIAHVTVLSFVYQASLVLVGNIVSRRLSKIPGIRRMATRLAGVALVGFGIRLAFNR